MKILNLRVNWYLNFANDPSFEALVSDVPHYDELRYENRDWAWFAEKDGYVSFFAWSGPNNEGGFGGRQYTINMKDGSQITLKGPWSSGCYAMNAMGFPLSVELAFTEDKLSFDRGHTFFAGHCTKELIEDYLSNHPELNLELYGKPLGEGFHFVPTFKGMTPKESKEKVRGIL